VAMNHAGMCFPGTLGLAYLLGKTRGWVVQPLAGVLSISHINLVVASGHKSWVVLGQS